MKDGAPQATAQTVALSFFRFEGLASKLWAFSQMQLARAPLARHPQIGFFKLFGTGTREGFHPAPNFGVYAVMTTWPDPETASAEIAATPVFQRYRRHAAESWTVYLSPLSCRGEWSGRAPFDARPERGDEPVPIAVLTRATVKTRHIPSFWRHTPDIGAMIRAQTALPFKIGMGEIPWRNQVTFSIWSDLAAMQRFAYGDGAHRAAIRAVREGNWFWDELFARFRVLSAEGSWDGRDPLAGLAVSPRLVGAVKAPPP